MPKLRVLIVGDQTIIREALKSLLNARRELSVVGVASDSTLELAALSHLRPSVVLLDLPSESGGQASISNVRNAFPDPDTRIVVLTKVEDRFNVERLLKAGAGGIVFKRTDVSELMSALKTVAHGQSYLDPAIRSRTVTQVKGAGEKHGSKTLDLSERERQVLTYIASGHTHKDIAGLLHISVKTVETYRYRIVEKLGLRSRAELVRYALLHGLVHLPSVVCFLYASLTLLEPR